MFADRNMKMFKELWRGIMESQKKWIRWNQQTMGKTV